MSVEIGVLISVCGILLSAGTFFVGRMTAAKTDGFADGELKSDVRHIKDSVDKQGDKLDTVIENYENISIELEKLKGRVTALEQKVKLLHGEDV